MPPRLGPCWWVGWWLWGAVSRKTPIYFMVNFILFPTLVQLSYLSFLHGGFDLQPRSWVVQKIIPKKKTTNVRAIFLLACPSPDWEVLSTFPYLVNSSSSQNQISGRIDMSLQILNTRKIILATLAKEPKWWSASNWAKCKSPRFCFRDLGIWELCLSFFFF